MSVEWVHPSALAWADRCERRFIGHHDEADGRLPVSLEAVRGQILHAVREKLARHTPRDGASLRAVAKLVFEDERARTQSKLSSTDWWVGDYDLEERLPWGSVRSILIPMANREAQRDSASAPSRPRHRVSGHIAPRGDFIGPLPGVEVSFQSSRFHLRGVVDEVQVADGGFRIVEVKTAPAAAAGEEARVQACSYALAVEDLSDRQVTGIVVVGPRGETPVDWDGTKRSEIVSLIERARQADWERPVPAPTHCHSCPVRHRCGAYHQAAVAWWSAATDGPPTRDVWGSVIGVEWVEDKLRVDLRRPDGARVTIRGVHPDRLPLLEQDAVRVYGLEATESRGLHGRSAAAMNWHEAADEIASGLIPAWGTLWLPGELSDTSAADK